MNKILITFVFMLHLNYSLSFKWKDCGKKDRLVHFEDVKISPEQPKLGNPLVIGATFKVNDYIEEGSKSLLKIKKHIGRGFFSVPIAIPCVNGFGSCKGDLCGIFKHGPICQFLKNIGSECKCPLKPDVYKAYGGKPIQLPSGKGLGGLFAKGKYSFEWKWLSPKGEELGCLSAELKLIK